MRQRAKVQEMLPKQNLVLVAVLMADMYDLSSNGSKASGTCHSSMSWEPSALAEKQTFHVVSLTVFDLH